MKYRICLFTNGKKEDTKEWELSLKNKKDELSYELINSKSSDWFKQISNGDFDIIISRPSGETAFEKCMFDEKLDILKESLDVNLYPNIHLNKIYENKRFFHHWLNTTNIPHAKTKIFFELEESLLNSEKLIFPKIVKTSFGASSSGVIKVRNQSEYRQLCKKIFRGNGIKRYSGPNLRKGDKTLRFMKRLLNPLKTIKYFNSKRLTSNKDSHRDYMIVQDFIETKCEWRTVVINNSFFGHKKISDNDGFYSGTSLVEWLAPPKSLLNFIRNISKKYNIDSSSIDIFEDKSGNFIVNEIQCYFGSKNPHQMIVDGVPGRFVFDKDKWIFEGGNFNTNNSHDLRLDHVLEILKNG